MSLAFLYPLALLGAAAIAAPVWLHLRRKEETNLFKFSALRFLDDQPHPRRSPLRLRDLLLLALRVLAVMLLVTAFAWPYSSEPVEAVATEARVYVLDNTLSHQVDGGFTHDRDAVVREIGQAGKEVQIAVVELTSQPRIVVNFGDSPELAEQKLRELEPSFQRGPYLAAFRQANALLAQSLGSRKRIVFLGDNQENQWRENAEATPFLENVEVELPVPSSDERPNLALAAPRARRVFLGDKAVVDFAVDLYHQGDAKSARVTVRANGRDVFHGDVDLAEQPETITLGGQWESDYWPRLRGEVRVEGEPDALDGDNVVYFALPRVREGKVALLARSTYLRTALSPDVMRGRWAARTLDPTKLKDETDPSRDADVLVVESDYLQSSDARSLVLRYLNAGRGVLLLVNRTTPLTNGFLRELGFEPQPATAEKPRTTAFRYVYSDHPIFHPFRSPDFGNLLEIKVHQYQRLKAPQAVPLVFSQSGDGLFFQATQTKGKLFVAAFGFDRADTNWPLHQTFIPFLDLCLEHARAEDTVPTAFEPGEMCVLTLPGDRASHELVLRDGDTGRELVREPVEHGRVRFRIPAKPGLYTMTHDGEPDVERVLTVNPSPLESRLKYDESPEAIDAWQLRSSGDAPATPRESTLADLTLASILEQRIAWWLLLVGLAALAAETAWLAARKEQA